ncbi:hypothetical protein GCM10027030_01080 [Luteococcus sediminum]
MDHPQEVTGRVVAPRAGRDLPVVVFLHGRHQWCEEGAGEWPCAEGSSPVPNLEGYRHLQEELASRGYFTVSIDANAINAQDQVLPRPGHGRPRPAGARAPDEAGLVAGRCDGTFCLHREGPL